MIKKMSDYDQTSAFGQSEFKPLPKGGYICRVIKAEETQSSTGKPMLHIAFDIIEGDYTGYFMTLFQTRKKKNDDPLKEIKYPFEGQKWIMLQDYEDPKKTSRQFKGFCTAVEDSGTEIWNLNGELDLERVKGAEVGIVFQDVESEYNGESYWRAQPWGFRSIESIAMGDYFIPDDKPLPVTYNSGFQPATSADSFNAAEDDIPFK